MTDRLTDNQKLRRHPQSIALDAWLDSGEGQQCLASSASGAYLRNRLTRAFQAGWNANERHVAPPEKPLG